MGKRITFKASNPCDYPSLFKSTMNAMRETLGNFKVIKMRQSTWGLNVKVTVELQDSTTDSEPKTEYTTTKKTTTQNIKTVYQIMWRGRDADTNIWDDYTYSDTDVYANEQMANLAVRKLNDKYPPYPDEEAGDMCMYYVRPLTVLYTPRD